MFVVWLVSLLVPVIMQTALMLDLRLVEETETISEGLRNHDIKNNFKF
jgi:hypothetical protein